MDRIADLLIEQFEYDVAVMSEPWMYYYVLVPIALYVAFFFAKWSVLTAPAWLPVVFIAQAFRR